MINEAQPTERAKQRQSDLRLFLAIAVVLIFGYAIPYLILTEPFRVMDRAGDAIRPAVGSLVKSYQAITNIRDGCRRTTYNQVRASETPLEVTYETANAELKAQGWQPGTAANQYGSSEAYTWRLEYDTLSIYHHTAIFTLSPLTSTQALRDLGVTDQDLLQYREANLYHFQLYREDGAGCPRQETR